MKSTSAAVLAFCVISAIAAPPARRDEWQPTTSTVSLPEGAPVPAPTAHPNTEWQPEGNQTCVYINSNYQWTGYGINLCNPAGECSDKLPDGLSGKVLSVGPSAGQVCFLYSSQYCTGKTSDPIVHPGHSNLDEIDFGNMAESWKCYKMWPPGDPAASSFSMTSSSTMSSATSSSSIMSTPTGSTTTLLTTTTSTTSSSAMITSSTSSARLSISTTISTISNPQTTPGGIPISRTSSTSKASSMAMSTATVTVVPVSPSSTASTTSTRTSIIGTTTTTTYVVAPPTGSSTICEGFFCLQTSRTSLSTSTIAASSSTQRGPPSISSTFSSSTFATSTAPQRGQPTLGEPPFPFFTTSMSMVPAATSSSSFSFNPVTATFVTHTFADGAVTTTQL